jgi:hypothetical protein
METSERGRNTGLGLFMLMDLFRNLSQGLFNHEMGYIHCERYIRGDTK